jgi:hypothetical protein
VYKELKNLKKKKTDRHITLDLRHVCILRDFDFC